MRSPEVDGVASAGKVRVSMSIRIASNKPYRQDMRFGWNARRSQLRGCGRAMGIYQFGRRRDTSIISNPKRNSIRRKSSVGSIVTSSALRIRSLASRGEQHYPVMLEAHPANFGLVLPTSEAREEKGALKSIIRAAIPRLQRLSYPVRTHENARTRHQGPARYWT